MKLALGKGSYDLGNDVGRVILVSVSDKDGGHGGFQRVLELVTLESIISHRQRDRQPAMPRQFTFHKNWLEIWPPPDKAYDCVVRYYPAAREL